MSDPSSATGGITLQQQAARNVDAAQHAQDSDGKGPEKPRSLAGDAWRELRCKPLFLVSAGIIGIILLIGIAPGLFTHTSPVRGQFDNVRLGPNAHAWFGYDNQGRDVYARTIYGARASLVVSLASTVLTVIFGSVIGIVAGYYGKLVDSVLARFGDIFAGIPFVLGAIIILTTFDAPGSDPGEVLIIAQVVLSISVLAWPVVMRIMRSATLVAKQQDYVKAARGLGANTFRIMTKHMLPNTLAPVLVYSTILLGANIGAEATLAFLGIGLHAPVVSWGTMINEASQYVRVAPHMLLFPAAFVTLTVLAFSIMGDAIRDAFDPKSD